MEYKKGFEKAKKNSMKNWEGEYHLFYYEKLNYVVPVAFQSSVALIVDLDGTMINDIYYENPKYKIQDIHICIFPLKNTSVVMMFVDSNFKRYRNFYKKFNKLPHDQKLSTINYIMFLYSEDIFLSKELPKDILENENLRNVSSQTSVAFSFEEQNAIERAKLEFDLNKRNSIPNLLSEEYKLRY